VVQVKLESHILGANDLLARKNRAIYQQNKILAINLMSSPGAGKTTILERTIEALADKLGIAVIEGDLYTDQDAQRIEKKGVKVVQINTDGTCHLDAGMVDRAFKQIEYPGLQLLFIENVGNLVCPAEFDLGEDLRVVIISTTEGNDKITKYPLIFREAKVVILNKIDLLPYTDFSLEQFQADIGRINSGARIFMVSGRTGQGIDEWNQWLFEEVRLKISTL
jgi:hydrogenase nickel incorporation protein HypB